MNGRVHAVLHELVSCRRKKVLRTYRQVDYNTRLNLELRYNIEIYLGGPAEKYSRTAAGPRTGD